MPAKTLVIGLDGATLDVIEPLASEGRIPNLTQIMNQGTYGMLRSTCPPSSSVAWPSFMTGKNPGKHSIFYFSAKPYGTYYLEPVTSMNIKSPALWEELSRANKRVAVINVPMTYPPRRVNGMMITGLGTPASATTYTYPQEFTAEIEKTLGGRLPEVRWTEYKDENIPQFIQDVSNLTERTYEIASYVLEKELWDFFMVVFTGPDRMQHRLWNYMDYTNDQFVERVESDKQFAYIAGLVKNYFTFLDNIVANLMGRSGDNANIVILSDHGAGKCSKTVDINNLLAEWGYLRYNESTQKGVKRSLAKSVAKKMGISREIVKKIKKLSGLPFDHHKFLEKHSKVINQIDWDRTKAFCYTGDSVYINVKGRERRGIVDPDTEYEKISNELRSAFLNLTDPVTGNKLISQVKSKEEVYSGPFLREAPDLIFTEGDEGYDFANLLFSENRDRGIFLESDSIHQGTHRFDGFYAIVSKKIKSNFCFHEAHIIDLFPTILYLMDMPISDDVDGKVLLDTFKESKKEIKFSTDRSEADSSIHAVTEDEKEKIIDELKGLGYM